MTGKSIILICHMKTLLSGLIIKIPPEGAEVKLFLVEGV
jgi:hypothetical protein